MPSENNENKAATAVVRFRFWTSPAGSVVEVGPSHQSVDLPSVPLPVLREELQDGPPSTDAIGRGVYDYLRQYPDCPHNLAYAELLRDAFPHFLADLGAQVAMLDHKEVDPLYVRRKITGMKILALLTPGNAGLWRQMGVAAFDLAMTFSQLLQCRFHLLEGMGYLRRALKLDPNDAASLNYLAQIDYLLGDYPSAGERWQRLCEGMDSPAVRQALAQKVERISREEVPDHPVVDDLEAVGEALAACGHGEYEEAKLILERLEEEGTLPAECPTSEFFYLLGLCRGKTGDLGSAFAAFEKALELDPDYAPAQEGREMILDGREF
ncbi:MAG: tetratricopeptide repeat protein [Desulfuromonadales bacterium]|nr:tetratricopeptide repeat protein [Desulfuromonadales bacterium]